ncbi:hypothetical protein NDU88_011643 [Pleurodeles waltl]|uniref:Uncharacterized protein n=1 Tax=Pleurodeles waltl TaxID=8319 RepID=A0AAV7R295_PLEWA|nr:hypothetical protein NDU88_011643 [Pleurodeles waltl]
MVARSSSAPRVSPAVLRRSAHHTGLVPDRRRGEGEQKGGREKEQGRDPSRGLRVRAPPQHAYSPPPVAAGRIH